MESVFTRREALKRVLIAAGTLLCGNSAKSAAANPYRATSHLDTNLHLDPQDHDAEALSYHENAATVDTKQFPTYQPGQRCGKCVQLGGDDGEQWRPCRVMEGKLVSANGWCEAFFSKS